MAGSPLGLLLALTDATVATSSGNGTPIGLLLALTVEGTTTPPTTFPGGGDFGHRGSEYWRRYQAQLKGLKKKPKKKKLLEELDEMIAELQSHVVEAQLPDDDSYERTIRVSQALVMRDDFAQLANARIQAQIDILERAIRELDDEEAILLALH